MCGAVEEPLTAVDRSLGGVTQGFARCVEAESVKRFSSTSKSTASRSYRSTRKRQGPKEGPETEFENRVMLDLDQACAEVVLHPCWVMVCISYILYVTIERLSK